MNCEAEEWAGYRTSLVKSKGKKSSTRIFAPFYIHGERGKREEGKEGGRKSLNLNQKKTSRESIT